MATRWTKHQEQLYAEELRKLYILENKTISEIGVILKLSPSTVYDRLIRLKIPSTPKLKVHYLNKRQDITIPKRYSKILAEFFGVMLGDGKLSHFQIAVTLGNKEEVYAAYVAKLFYKLFGVYPKIITDIAKGYRIVYLGSIKISKWLITEGLVYNKVAMQVDVPRWILSERKYIKRFVRGFFDTDGSIYKLKYGVQLSFTNYSLPLLISLQWSLRQLGYRVSKISGHRFYLTRIDDIKKFFKEIKPCNPKHVRRFHLFMNLKS